MTARSSSFNRWPNARSRTLDSVSDHVPLVINARVVAIDDILSFALLITPPVVFQITTNSQPQILNPSYLNRA
jgi:hypothetical protein